MEQKPLTIEELKEMAGQPVWCPDEEAYGIVMCDKIGQWAGIPFLHGVWYGDGNGCGVEFNHNIIKRRLRCYRTISVFLHRLDCSRYPFAPPFLSPNT